MTQNNTDRENLPKVLIVGDSFSNSGGGGITMTNLFKDWPKDRIAVATTHVVRSGLDSCLLYYRLGYEEDKRMWPLYYVQPKYASGPLVYTQDDIKPEDSVSHKTSRSKYNPRLKNTVLRLIQISGFSFLQNRLKVSHSFLNWLHHYKPDLIYTQLATYELIKFTQEIKSKTNIPVAIHIMDDWPVSLNKPGLLYYYWKYKLDHEFRKLLDHSDIFISICDAMSREYEKRYHKPFKAFHNPIVISKWLPFSKTDWAVKDVFKIIYTGRIGTANGKAIVEIAGVVSSLRADGENIALDIYSPDGNTTMAKQIKLLDGISIKDPVPHNAMPTLLPKYDLAVLPLDFDQEGIRFAQFSMPTKASEYMISATPVMIYADRRTALAQYATEEKWGYVVTENSKEAVKTAIRTLLKDDKLRQHLGQLARETSIKNENAETVVQHFRNTLSSCLKTKLNTYV